MSEPRSDAQIAELLVRARAGDGEALGALLAAFRDDLRRQADRLLDGRLAGRIDASDLVQVTCLSVHRKIEDFVGDDAAQFAAWLRQVHERNVRNAVRDHAEAAKRAAGDEQPLQDVEPSDPRADTASRMAVWNETNSRLMNALGDLPAEEQEALRRRYLAGESLAEVSESMKLGKEAVVWLMHKGMRRLRAVLKDDSL